MKSQRSKTIKKTTTKTQSTSTIPPLKGSLSFIYAKNFDASVKFYSKTLGLKLAGKLGDNVRLFKLPGMAYLGVVREGVSAAANPPKSAKSAGVATNIVGLLCKGAKEVDGYYRRLKAAKAAGIGKPEKNDTFGLYNFICKDPAGYLVEVQAFLKPLKL